MGQRSITPTHLSIARYEGAVLGLPPRAMVVTNTERNDAACLRRWWFGHHEGLRPRGKERPLRYGEAWALVTEDLHRWWMAHDTAYPSGAEERCPWCAPVGGSCSRCAGTGLGVVARVARSWDALERSGAEVDAARDAECLRRALFGYFHVYGSRPRDEWRVVGVEVAMAAPIVHPTLGGPYAPEMVLVPEAGAWRLARTGEGARHDARIVRWPWFQLGKLDALYQHRSSYDLMVWEGKSSTDPAGYIRDLSVDPQVVGYVWLVGHHVKHFGSERVAGYYYDVSSSVFQADPDLLAPKPVKVLGPDGEPVMNGKRYVYEVDGVGEQVLRSPGLSRAQATTPSWRYEAAIAAHGFARSDYEDKLAEVESTVDPRLYVPEFGTAGPEAVARYARELYAVAQQLATVRRRCAYVTDPRELDAVVPRNPVCRHGGRCAYRGPCLMDGEQVRADFDVRAAAVWADDVLPFSNDNIAAMPAQEKLGW